MARAAKEFDKRVPALRTPVNDHEAAAPRWKLFALIALLVIMEVVMVVAFIVMPSSLMLLSVIIRVVLAHCAFAGFTLVRSDTLYYRQALGAEQKSCLP